MTVHLAAVVAIGLGGILVVLVLALLLIRGLLTAAHNGLRWAARRALGVKVPARSSRLAGRGSGRHRQPGPAVVRRRPEPAPTEATDADPLRVHLPKDHVPSWALHTEVPSAVVHPATTFVRGLGIGREPECGRDWYRCGCCMACAPDDHDWSDCDSPGAVKA